MAKKWAIADGPPLKVRLAWEKENDRKSERIKDKPSRVRIVGRHIVKILVTLWMLTVGAWLQACHNVQAEAGADADGPQDAIDGHNPFCAN